MNSATISCDIIASTKLHSEDRQLLQEKIKSLLVMLTEIYSEINFYGRLVKGDYIECAIQSPVKSLRIALIIKSFIKSLNLPSKNGENIKLKYFKEHGARIAVAIGELILIDSQKEIIDGEAIYLSGRALQNLETSGKEKIIIKKTIFYLSNDDNNKEAFEALFSLLDVLFSRHSSKQSEIIFHKLLGKNELKIARLLKRSQSTINQHSTSSGWNAIEKSIRFFENTVK